MAFKMKGSPMQRNFGVGAALKQKVTGYETNTKTGEIREVYGKSADAPYGSYSITKKGSKEMIKNPDTRKFFVASDKSGNRLVGDIDPKTTESADAKYKPENTDTKTTVKNDDKSLKDLPKGAKRVTDKEGNLV